MAMMTVIKATGQSRQRKGHHNQPAQYIPFHFYVSFHLSDSCVWTLFSWENTFYYYFVDLKPRFIQIDPLAFRDFLPGRGKVFSPLDWGCKGGKMIL
jgi:hypothetical protein